jgi:hypothetical protein
MYEDLNQIAQLKFAKQMEFIAAQTQQNLREARQRFAATAGVIIRSGQQDALLGRLRIEGVERVAGALFQIWLDLIKSRNGHVARVDIGFITKKIEDLVNAQRVHLRSAFAHEGGATVSSLVQEADMRMHAVVGNARRDLEIMVREYEAFPKRDVSGRENMTQKPSRFSVGRRVLFGMANRVGTVRFVADAPGQMGEFVHELLEDKTQEVLQVLGCDIRPFPDSDEDLRGARPAIHIQNSNVANLNVGSQTGTISSNLQAISAGGNTQRDFAGALEQLTQAVASESALQAAEKQEVIEAIATLSQEAAKKPEERSRGTLKALVTWLPTTIAAANNLVTLWDKLGPTVKGYFGI